MKKRLKRVSRTKFVEIKTPEEAEKHFSVDSDHARQVKKAINDLGMRWELTYGPTTSGRTKSDGPNLSNLPRPAKSVDSAWLLAQLKEYTERMVATAEKKNADYAGASPKPFANFSHVEDLGIATTEQGFLTRMTDKLCRVLTFAKKGVLQVSDESVEDTLLDLANYALLMASYIKAKKAGTL